MLSADVSVFRRVDIRLVMLGANDPETTQCLSSGPLWLVGVEEQADLENTA
jgi:hypothetical protein